VNPEPVTVTLVPPFRQVPGLAVRPGGPLEVELFALHGTVVDVVVVDELVVVVVVVVVVLAVVVVVPVFPVVPVLPLPPEKLMACVA
jgi:hypothetical protein